MSIRTRKRGKTYSYIFEAGKTASGKRKVVERGGFATAKDAYRAGVDAYADYTHGNIGITSESISVADFAVVWLKNAALNVREGTLLQYKTMLNRHILPLLGFYKVQELTPALLNKWLSDKAAEGLSYNTLKSMRAVIKTMLNYAVLPAELIANNPALYVAVPKNTPRQVVSRSLVSADTLAAMLADCPARSPMSIILQLLYHTGARIGEVLGLGWQDIDFDRQTITISKQLRLLGGTPTLAAPKTATSQRQVIIDGQLVAALKAWKRQQAENEIAAAGGYCYIYLSENDRILQQSKNLPATLPRLNLICTQKSGRLMLAQYVNRFLRKYGLNAHSFRHTHATMLIEAGAVAKGVAGRLGHSDATITQNLYTHNTASLQQETAKIFGKMIK
jgi:integrase